MSNESRGPKMGLSTEPKLSPGSRDRRGSCHRFRQFGRTDTCCIDKKNNTELSEAINSMFRWYRKATRCYVYLSDVSIRDEQQSCQYSCFAWEAAFRKSRWFTRGWTLQELIAPTLLDFFSSEGERLGNKSSLETMVH